MINYNVAVDNVKEINGEFTSDHFQVLMYTFISYTVQTNMNLSGTYFYNVTLSIWPTSFSTYSGPYSSKFEAYGFVQDVIGNFSLLHEPFGATDEIVAFKVSHHQGTHVWYEWTWKNNDTDR